MALPPNFKDRLLKKLNERGVRNICEACGRNNWAVVDQPIGLMISDMTGGLRIPMPQIPAAGLVCNNCGNVRIFALGALDLLPEREEAEVEND